MKNIFQAALCLLLALGLTACSRAPQPPVQPDPPEPPPAPEAPVTPEAPELPEPPAPDPDGALCAAVRRYYEESTGHPYPGHVAVSEHNPDGTVTVQLYEDTETHRATIAYYTVDPTTYRGVDDIFGTEIDFSPYREDAAAAAVPHAILRLRAFPRAAL